MVFCFRNNCNLTTFTLIKQTENTHKNRKTKKRKGNILGNSINNYGKEYFERTKKLKHLCDELDIDPYPSSFKKRNIKLSDLKQKCAYLKNGETEKETLYVVYGRVMVKRNNGMFLKIQDDEENIQVYVDKHVELKKETHKGMSTDLGVTKKQHSSVDVKESEQTETKNMCCGEGKSCQNKQHHIVTSGNGVLARKIIEVGDFICVEGSMRKTLKGEITIAAKTITLLAKALLPLPDKYKGMKDMEYIYRKRYLHFLTNIKEREKILTRFRLLQEIRFYLKKKKYLEVDTPILQLIPGGATAKAFETFLKSLNLHLYLRVAPELFLKKLIISGISEQIFELNKCFRNEGVSTVHSPEFTILEVYKAFSNYKYMMKFTEKLIKHLVKKLNVQTNFNILQKKWKKISFIKIIKKYTSLNFLKFSCEQALEQAKKLHITFDQDPDTLNWGLVVEEVFKKKVEPRLTEEPLHIFHFPSNTSPLAKTLKKNKKLSERFETYIGKMEIANGYSEEANPLEQENKFLAQYMLTQKKNSNRQEKIPTKMKQTSNQMLVKQGETTYSIDQSDTNDKKQKNDKMRNIDYDYLTALCHGLPPTGGLGIGIDRLCMLFTGSNSIKSIIPFPIIKPNESF